MNISDLQKPSVIRNGSGAIELERQYRAAFDGMNAALEALAQMRPNGRDYQDQNEGAFMRAKTQHEWHVSLLRTVQKNVETLYEAFADTCDKFGIKRE
jgi:hypothetical protein